MYEGKAYKELDVMPGDSYVDTNTNQIFTVLGLLEAENLIADEFISNTEKYVIVKTQNVFDKYKYDVYEKSPGLIKKASHVIHRLPRKPIHKLISYRQKFHKLMANLSHLTVMVEAGTMIGVGHILNNADLYSYGHNLIKKDGYIKRLIDSMYTPALSKAEYKHNKKCYAKIIKAMKN